MHHESTICIGSTHEASRILFNRATMLKHCSFYQRGILGTNPKIILIVPRTSSSARPFTQQGPAWWKFKQKFSQMSKIAGSHWCWDKSHAWPDPFNWCCINASWNVTWIMWIPEKHHLYFHMFEWSGLNITRSLRKVFRRLRAFNPDSTINQLIKQFSKQSAGSCLPGAQSPR